MWWPVCQCLFEKAGHTWIVTFVYVHTQLVTCIFPFFLDSVTEQRSVMLYHCLLSNSDKNGNPNVKAGIEVDQDKIYQLFSQVFYGYFPCRFLTAMFVAPKGQECENLVKLLSLSSLNSTKRQEAEGFYGSQRYWQTKTSEFSCQFFSHFENASVTRQELLWLFLRKKTTRGILNASFKSALKSEA